MYVKLLFFKEPKKDTEASEKFKLQIIVFAL